MGKHDDIAQSLGSMGVCQETEESIDNHIQVILSTHLTHHYIFFWYYFVRLFEQTIHIELVVMLFIF